ncbi:pilus assembly protein TadG-related protein [Asticcacaulis sp. BYS171W]|uniref:Pilus assembly protein TadG-related protein n=1 Tax=Asticcacaulis aquaticus TaxID=2984212 RepID=A0ABT5HW29_9CAUL|nr:pilus assembly protein TadG-related protein [Asticcacaulis aquaticus]MDC7684297.1 pilus assembly protein TadG-related protein [Asticcacaulis aquaticus]
MTFSLPRLLERYRRHHKGNVTMIFALTLTALLGLTGGAIDYYSAWSVKSSLQDAMDASVLAGLHRDTDQRAAEAGKVFASNLPADMTLTPTYATDATTLSGQASYQSPTLMLGLIGISHLPLRVAATAIGTPGTGTAGPCILVLDPTGAQALLVNSGAKIVAPECEIHVKSKASPAAIFNSGSSLDFKKLCLEGSNVIRNSTTVNNLSLSCATAADSWGPTLPAVADSACTASNGNFNDASVNLSPGTYCGWFNFNNGAAKVNFAPGLYVIKNGGWNVNGGTWTGNGVTFYFADTSKIQFNSGIAASLSAPTSGTYKNVLFFEKPALSKSDFIFNNAKSNKMTGLIWLPSRNVTFNAQSLMDSDSLTMVINRLIVNQTAWNLTPETTNKSSSGGLTNIRLAK